MGKAAAKLCNHNTTLMEEVCQGMELARQLGTHLHNASSTQTRDLLVKSILSSYDKALKLLQCNTNQLLDPSSAPSESPPSGSNSPKSDGSDSNKDRFRKHSFKKRKTLTQWTEHVRVCGEAGPEGPLADGYSWRKYGQKDILGSSFPRGYYRCTHRHVRGCLATKQVQRSDRDPSVLEITYRGRHTCSQAPRLTPRSLRSPPPARVEANTAPYYAGVEVKIQSANPRSPLQPPCSTEIAIDFGFGRTCQVNSEDIESKDGIFPPPSSPLEDRAFVQSMAGSGGFLPAFLPPAMSESDYFLGGWNLPGSESDLPETNSEPIAVAVSPIGCLDFPMDPVEFDPNFSFDALEFFTSG